MTIAEFYANFSRQSLLNYETGKSPFRYKGAYLYSVLKDKGEYLAYCGSGESRDKWTVPAMPDDEIEAAPAPDASREK